MSLLNFAKQELDIIGMKEDSSDEMNVAMRKHILHMVQEFADEGHSGFSASYAISILEKILRYQPLTPLTGEDSEWAQIDFGPDMKYQNKRCSHVFKNEAGEAYDSEGIIYYDWVTDGPDEEPYRSCYTNSDSRVYISFPYEPKHEYMERDEDRC